MLLYPKNPRYTKAFSNRKIIKTDKIHNNKTKFAKLSIIAKEAGLISNYQIESIRLFLRRFLKKRAQLFFRIFPNQSITKKPNEIRLGRGKGNLKYWAFFVKKNTIMIEISGQNTKLINSAIHKIKNKLRIKTFLCNQQFR